MTVGVQDREGEPLGEGEPVEDRHREGVTLRDCVGEGVKEAVKQAEALYVAEGQADTVRQALEVRVTVPEAERQGEAVPVAQAE